MDTQGISILTLYAFIIGGLGLIVGIPLSMVLFFLVKSRKDEAEKKVFNRLALWFLLTPFVLLFISFISMLLIKAVNKG